MTDLNNRERVEDEVDLDLDIQSPEKPLHLGEALIRLISEQYNLSNLRFLEKVDKGYLSDNYVLESEGKRFFLKKHRTADLGTVSTTLNIEQFFADRGVPAILPIPFGENQTLFQAEDGLYSLYPFVEGSHGHRMHYSKTALKSAAEMLAKIHIAGQKDYPSVAYDDFAMWTKEEFLDKAKSVKELIRPETDFDRMALAYLDLKIKVVTETDEFPFEKNFGTPQLIHGDYHGSNIFFDDKEQVAHVFDFEKAQIQPSVLEVVRSVNFLCFGGEFSEDQFESAEYFLRSYQEVIPIDLAYLRNALWFWHFRQVYSLWEHTEHYEKNNTRVDNLVEKRYGYLKYYSENIKTHVEKLMNRMS
jgi:Ser/Thr protein kinase RdoA (MazF antagonist)